MQDAACKDFRKSDTSILTYLPIIGKDFFGNREVLFQFNNRGFPLYTAVKRGTAMKIYCAGKFDFAYRDYSPEHLAQDYRGLLVEDAGQLIKETGDAVRFKAAADAEYIGPFYFYEDQKTAEDIVAAEIRKIEEADCVFFYFPDSAACPGTVTELVHAALLGKKLVIVYEPQGRTEEPENELDSSVWYPLLFALRKNGKNTALRKVPGKSEAVAAFREYLRGEWK